MIYVPMTEATMRQRREDEYELLELIKERRLN